MEAHEGVSHAAMRTSWRREPACDEIWMSTLASGMSSELSPTWGSVIHV